jgi:hypothetical protein
VPSAATITLIALGTVGLAAWVVVTWVYAYTIRRQGAATPEPALDVPEVVLGKLAPVEAWADERGYEWVDCYRLAVTYNGLWRKGFMLLVATVGDVGEPDVGFNSAFSEDRELISTSRRLNAAHAVPRKVVVQHWLGAELDELEQFHEEGLAYLRGEAGWGRPIAVPEGAAMLSEIQRTHERWTAFAQRPLWWPLRFTAALLRASTLPRKRSARQRLPLARARRV